MSTDEWYEERYNAEERIRLILEDNFSDLLDLAGADDAPVIRVECPRGHQIARVRMMIDHNWAPFLVTETATSDQASESSAERWQALTSAEPGGGERVGAVAHRNRAKCPRCAFDGRPTLAELMTEYAKSFRLGRKTIALRA